MHGAALSLLIFTFIVTLSACGSHKRESLQPVGGLPPFPVDRQSSLVVTALDGIETYSRSANAYEVNDFLSLPAEPDEDQLAWAVYQFSTATAPKRVELELYEESTTEAWLGVADFEAGRWEVLDSVGVDSQFELDHLRHRSANGSVFVAVIVDKGHLALIERLILADHTTPPVARLSATPTNLKPGDAVVLDASQSIAPDGQIVRYEWDLDEDWVFETDGGSDPTLEVFAPAIKQWRPSVRVTDDAGLTDTINAWISVYLPTATFMVKPLVGPPGAVSELDATYSYGIGGIVKYEWDLDGNGMFETDAGNDPTMDTTFPEPANTEVKVSLRVTDSLGFTGVRTRTLGSTSAYILAPNAYRIAGLHTVQGNPAVVFSGTHGDLSGLIYRRALDAAGEEWGEPVLIENIPYTVAYPCFSLVNGRPTVVYSRGYGFGDIMFATAEDELGTSWDAPVIVREAGELLETMHRDSLAEVNGHPACILARYSSETFFNTAVYFIRATDAAGSAWSEPVLLQESETGGVARPTYNNLQVIDGKPVASYGFGRIARALDPNGEAWEVESLPFRVLEYRLVNGLPATANADPDYTALQFNRALDLEGDSWGPQTELEFSDPLDIVGGMRVINGVPWVISSSKFQIRYYVAADADGSSFGPVQQLAAPLRAEESYYVDMDIIGIPGGAALLWLGEPGSQQLYYQTVQAP